MSTLCPPRPEGVPETLTQASASYRRRAYLAVFALVVFLAAYFGLAAWFAYTSIRLFGLVGQSRQTIMLVIAALSSGLLAVFMIKAVFFVRRGKIEGLVPLDLERHPELARFIAQVADEAGAPHPRQVFLSHDVNAAVFYDLSLLNLFLPAKKNLLIGLGLVNVLNLSELKAVLAHEFGHFAQRSMKIGRWVYITQQIAAHLVARRDALDRMLEVLSAQDVRIAWVGWLLRLVIWSIRSLVDTVFGWVVLIERALTRQMEFQADLVAVSLSGSDALIHGLSKAQSADEELDRAMSLMAAERGEGRRVADVYALQTWLIERRRIMLDDPHYGTHKPVPADKEAASRHRVFASWDHQPSRMWATHPANDTREENAKRTYIPSPLDDRSSWLLFADANTVRRDMTTSLYQSAEAFEDGLEPVALEVTFEALDKRFRVPQLDPHYRGLYLERSVVRHTPTPSGLVAQHVHAQKEADLAQTIASLYDEGIKEDLSLRRERLVEVATLEAIERGVLLTPGGVVRFRGAEYKRAEVRNLIERARADRAEVEERLRRRDATIRAVHLEAARRYDEAHPEEANHQEAYLLGLLEVLHFAEHTHADLVDLTEVFESLLQIVLADGKVSQSELERLHIEADKLHVALAQIYREAPRVELDEGLKAQLESTSWTTYLGEFQLPTPLADILGVWLENYRSWALGTAGQLRVLGTSALRALLEAEAELRDWVAGRAERVASRPARSVVKASYPTMAEGVERPRHLKLKWWDRFVLADGLLPSVLRLTVAGAIVASVLIGGSMLRGRG